MTTCLSTLARMLDALTPIEVGKLKYAIKQDSMDQKLVELVEARLSLLSHSSAMQYDAKLIKMQVSIDIPESIK